MSSNSTTINKRVIKLCEFTAHGSNVTSATIGHKSNKIAATGGEDKKVNIWALTKPTCIMSLTGHTSAVNSVTFSSNEDRIVSGSLSGSLKVWDLEANRLIGNLVGHKANVTCLEYHAYADYIASGSVDAQIRLWDLRRRGCIFTYKGHSNCINSIRFSPDSKWIASTSDDGLVKIWDLKAGRLLADLKGHTGPVNSVEFHPNEFLLATGSSDKTVRFWDLEKMESVSSSPSALNPIKVIMFEQNGKCLFSGSQDYLQSISWEPSDCYESVFCQWKHVVDMTNNANKLTACSFNQNLVSFYVVDLLQVAPIGVYNPPSHDETIPITSSRITNVGHVVNHHPSNRTLSSSNRKNFSHYEKVEATEQPDENQLQQKIENETVHNDNSQADIYNVEEYNKIFRPQKEIKRPSSTNSISAAAANIQTPPQPSIPSSTSFTSTTNKKSNLIAKKSIDSSVIHDETPKPAVDQSFFVDIKVAPNSLQKQISQPLLPTLQQQQQPQSPKQIKENFSTSIAYNNNSNNNNNNNLKEDKLEEKFDKVNINDFIPNQENQVKMDVIDLTATIEQGHDAFMKALKNRHKNVQMIRSMWINNSIKSALDTAVALNDTSLMADILNQINQSVNVWNLDICTILLPSIKELIGSKYEDHAQIGSDSCKIVFKNFGKLIKSSLLTPCGVGVDISREERQRKCNSCYNYLQDIISIIERKISSISSQKLLNNFKEINLLMKTLEN